MKKILALTLALLMIFSLSACNSDEEGSRSKEPTEESVSTDSSSTSDKTSAQDKGDDKDAFVVGAPNPLTGVNANAGIDGVNATKLAAEQINAEGGLLGHEVKVVGYDDQGTPEEAVKIASKMIEVDHVDAVIGSVISSCVLASAAALNDAGIVTFGTGTSPTWMAKDWPYVFRACANNDFTLPILVDFWDDLDIKSVAIFAGQDDASAAASDTVQQLSKDVGIDVVDVESHMDGDTDFSGQCAKIISSNPGVVFLATYGSTQPLIIKQLRQYGYKGLIFTKDLLQTDSIGIAGTASDYVGFAYPYLTYADIEECDDEDIKAFLEAYYDAYGELPNTDTAYRAYDSMMVLKAAAEKADSVDGEAIRAAVNEITDLKGLGGTFDYSVGDREGLHDCAIYVVLDESYVLFDKWIESGDYDAWLNQ